MPPTSPQTPSNSHTEKQTVSAFPELSDDLSTFPEIPGGWRLEEYNIGESTISLHRPIDPDLFLDDEDVAAANVRNDYMPFWAYLWPAAVKMSKAILKAPWSPDDSVLELGSGLGLVGLAAMSRGDRITFSDYDPTALFMCRKNALENGFEDPPVMQLDWREPKSEQFDAIFGCEVTYDAPIHSVLLDLLNLMLKPNGLCWLGDPGRYQSPKFYQLALDYGFEVRIFNEDFKAIEVPSSEGFQIFEIRKPDITPATKQP
ncbi:class I SAM-dependent methyltransferase [Thalassoglobus polymorphus]|uniref:Ribosomal protein L11 methyltransferase n=1 Tax=Thalassoglobus polymorphus TaxID=2527994 RepID=A0A517QJ24_9PLAN|nr:methyltransferase [Thalassoglobus polymorphus]QDT31608.1 Ribosomal protein L11 methyltransferase [Thalassoglobus polymorphus]